MAWVTLSDNKQHPDADIDNQFIYIGCMSGTSVDECVDFTAANFNQHGKVVCYQNAAIPLPVELRKALRHLSQTPADQISLAGRQHVESHFTQFLCHAYRQVIKQFNLENYPKENIVLSPHGQTIAHMPNIDYPYTDQLCHGETLSACTGYDVVFRHRQAAIYVSQAAPLAPVLIRQCFTANESNTIVLNGGGIANICLLLKDQPDHIYAWDTGPANGPLDALVQLIIDTQPAVIPEALRDDIIHHRYDVGGKLAATGKVLEEARARFLQHPYFHAAKSKKSADLSDFSVNWIAQCINVESVSIADILATLIDVIAISIANEIESGLSKAILNQPLRFIAYGGIIHNHTLMKAIRHYLDMFLDYECVDMSQLGYDPNFFESLLMAYLGFMVHEQRPIDVSYCKRQDVQFAKVIPGVLVSAGKAYV